MKRRSFLKAIGIGGAAIAAPSILPEFNFVEASEPDNGELVTGATEDLVRYIKDKDLWEIRWQIATKKQSFHVTAELSEKDYKNKEILKSVRKGAAELLHNQMRHENIMVGDLI